jgi:hypothetical protein
VLQVRHQSWPEHRPVVWKEKDLFRKKAIKMAQFFCEEMGHGSYNNAMLGFDLLAHLVI